jgi:hypothetical protein
VGLLPGSDQLLIVVGDKFENARPQWQEFQALLGPVFVQLCDTLIRLVQKVLCGSDLFRGGCHWDIKVGHGGS